jgi:hypothetical protein
LTIVNILLPREEKNLLAHSKETSGEEELLRAKPPRSAAEKKAKARDNVAVDGIFNL